MDGTVIGQKIGNPDALFRFYRACEHLGLETSDWAVVDSIVALKDQLYGQGAFRVVAAVHEFVNNHPNRRRILLAIEEVSRQVLAKAKHLWVE